MNTMVLWQLRRGFFTPSRPVAMVIGLQGGQDVGGGGVALRCFVSLFCVCLGRGTGAVVAFAGRAPAYSGGALETLARHAFAPVSNAALVLALFFFRLERGELLA